MHYRRKGWTNGHRGRTRRHRADLAPTIIAFHQKYRKPMTWSCLSQLCISIANHPLWTETLSLCCIYIILLYWSGCIQVILAPANTEWTVNIVPARACITPFHNIRGSTDYRCQLTHYSCYVITVKSWMIILSVINLTLYSCIRPTHVFRLGVIRTVLNVSDHGPI